MNFLWNRLPKGAQRRAARWFGRRLFRLQMKSPAISFTFDDFPRSALVNAGAILREHGFAGTYYTSLGLMGQVAPTGRIFQRDDLQEVVRQGHELACHTFDHCDSWQTEPSEFEASALRNQQQLRRLLPGVQFQSLSYPLSWPRPETKRRVAMHYKCGRGGGQTFNSGIVDLNYLNAFFIEQSRERFDAIQQVIDANARACGWLIFATHDVCDSPTRFGCAPATFKQVVKCAVQSGAAVLTVDAALSRIGGLEDNSVRGRASGTLNPSVI
jgi:peptidoglycan/xylan/chitin deacetylase (PgdA/CDA1 family)